MRFFTAFLLVSVSGSSALALNWEGHDEWMTEMTAAVEYDQAHPQAAPNWRLKPCAEPKNAYDQVPLPGRNCTDRKKSPKQMPEAVK